jgi:RecB family exonuclease
MRVTLRASSVSDLLDCPARWKAKHLDGKSIPKAAAAHLGTALHASTAVFDRAAIDGAGLTADEAAGALVDTLHHPDEEVDWRELSPSQAEPIGLALHHDYCTQLSPKQRYRAVELTCESLDIDVDGGGLAPVTLRLTGTADRVRETAQGLGIADLKTGKRAVDASGRAATQGHAAQLAIYELLASYSLGEEMAAPAQIIGLNTQSLRVGVGTLSRTQEALVGDPESPGLLDYIAKIFLHDLFYGNPRSLLCSARYCPVYSTCQWR